MLSEPQALGERERLRRVGLRVGFTNGCFDLLHVGHVRYLRDARALVDVLFVGLNDDATVRLLKGSARPIIPAEERAEVLGELASVDHVVLFSDRTAERLVALLQPDIYMKGGDYTLDEERLPEAAVVRACGGEVRLLRLEPGRSTTSIIQRIRSGSTDSVQRTE